MAKTPVNPGFFAFRQTKNANAVSLPRPWGMKTITLLSFLLLAAAPLACSKPDSAPPSGATSAKAAAAEAPKPAAAPAKAAFVQKGIQPGKVVVGYLQDAADASQCTAVTDEPAKKDDFTKNAEQVAKMMKATVVTSCPTDNVVGTCNAGFGMLINYSGPKWTKETAQKECSSQPHATWIE
jgi:hypothetical protein